MNSIPSILDIAPTLKLLSEKYPGEQINIEYYHNRPDFRADGIFTIWIGLGEFREFGSGPTLDQALAIACERSDKRPSLEDRVKAEIEKAKTELNAAQSRFDGLVKKSQ